eukprot:IDg5559t1
MFPNFLMETALGGVPFRTLHCHVKLDYPQIISITTNCNGIRSSELLVLCRNNQHSPDCACHPVYCTCTCPPPSSPPCSAASSCVGTQQKARTVLPFRRPTAFSTVRHRALAAAVVRVAAPTAVRAHMLLVANRGATTPPMQHVPVCSISGKRSASSGKMASTAAAFTGRLEPHRDMRDGSCFRACQPPGASLASSHASVLPFASMGDAHTLHIYKMSSEREREVDVYIGALCLAFRVGESECGSHTTCDRHVEPRRARKDSDATEVRGRTTGASGSRPSGRAAAPPAGARPRSG